jgi:hypothetical protein
MMEDGHMTLTEFLLARITEDEADARHSSADAMTGYRWKHYPRGAYEEIQALALGRARRVLAECEAKRKIVNAMGSTLGDAEQSVAAFVLKALALPHADHPDYDEEWRP